MLADCPNMQRDVDHHESLASSLRSLRNESTRSQSDLEHLKARNAELRRQLSIAESSQRAAQASAKRAEAAARALREEVTKAKRIVEQVRTQCANDLRKRDVQLSRLKSHLDTRGQQRGANRAAGGGLVITITPGKTGVANSRDDETALPSVEDEQYSLSQETTEFLTQLSQGLSDENDQLISLIRSTLSTLKQLQGLPHNQPDRLRHHSSRPGSSTSALSLGDGEELVHVSDVSCETLSNDLENVLSSLSDLLTNPSFAPIEEVHIREKEIQRLREGWEKMEGRWQEAMAMMQGWRKRLINGGDTIRLDELKRGLCLAEGLDTLSRRPFALQDRSANAGPGDVAEFEDEEVSGEYPQDEPDVNDLPRIEDDLYTSGERPLFEVDSNANSARPIFGTDVDIEPGTVSLSNKDLGLREADMNIPTRSPQVHDQLSHLNLSDSENTSPKPRSKAVVSTNSRESVTKSKSLTASRAASKKSVTKPASTRLPARKAPVPKARTNTQQRQSLAPERSLSVSQKLQLAEREAHRKSSSPLNLNEDPPGSESPLDFKTNKDDDMENADGVESGQASRVGSLRDPRNSKSPVKRAKIAGRPRRRKSTLLPEELEGLMMGR